MKEIDVVAERERRVLAIDPGNYCGWAMLVGSQVLHGVWDLVPASQRRFEGGGMRYVRLRRLLDGMLPLNELAYEEVRHHAGVTAAHVYGGYVATIQAWCEDHHVPYQAVPVATIKRTATGKGNAKKDAIVAAAKALGYQVQTDDEADAIFCLLCVIKP